MDNRKKNPLDVEYIHQEGFLMPRIYQYISNYEKGILELKAQGLTQKEIGAKPGFTKEQIHNFISRYNEKQRKIKAGVALKAKGRLPKDYEITEEMKINELKYIIICKDSKIKRLEMENELMRDFLSLTERK